ncbi:hypothetical protein ASE38_11150 [Cellulomonas sp. Root930]|nr:hypothetical protein ASE38_11150 [Cellulomonas sp. Root930]
MTVARTTRLVLTALFSALVALAAVVTASGPPAQAADLSRFDPGFIVSDAVFFNSTAMNAGTVQSFLDQKGSACVPADGNTCLKSYVESTTTRAATNRCTEYVGAATERSSTIIAKVAAACGVNPQVLLVTLQKEQGLVTALTGKSASTYQKAMGYGCPDTAACNALYYGFFNQVYSAASQFRNYALNPGSYSHRAGLVNNVRFHPNAACGTSPVLIRNQATAGLYNYTPYQPNGVALAAGYGTGDSCSSYGNRNFFSYFSDWFGSPTGNPPFGFLDSVTVSGLSVTASGWAIDPETNGPITVHMYVGSASQAFLANGSRPDVGAAIGKGDLHGYSTTMTASPGTTNVCVWAMNTDAVSSNTLLGCRTVVVPAPLQGIYDSAVADATGLTVSGWVYDPDALGSAVALSVKVDGVARSAVADQPRPDLDAALRVGPNHGFTVRIPATSGQHTVCVTALKAAPGQNSELGCRTATVVNSAPWGFIDSVTAGAADITVRGWALDPDTSDPIAVHVYVDSASQAIQAADARPDLSSLGKGPNHGYSATIPAAAGSHNVCLFAINATPGANTALGCRTVTVVNRDPIGFLDFITPGPGSVTVKGWALDPDTTASIAVHVHAGPASTAVTAEINRPDLDAVFKLGAAHGFSGTVPVAPGQQLVCVYAINASPGNNPPLGCRTVTVLADNRSPIGFVDAVTTSAGTVSVAGWALDQDSVDPVTVNVSVDGRVTPIVADRSRPDLGSFGVGTSHGFAGSVTAAAGPHTVCLEVVNIPTGPSTPLGCRTVTTP